jgi:hypothetical protein
MNYLLFFLASHHHAYVLRRGLLGPGDTDGGPGPLPRTLLVLYWITVPCCQQKSQHPLTLRRYDSPRLVCSDQCRCGIGHKSRRELMNAPTASA